MNHDELEAIRRRVDNDSGRRPEHPAVADRERLLAELDRKAQLLDRYGAQLEDVRRLTTDFEYEGREAEADRLRKIVGPR